MMRTEQRGQILLTWVTSGLKGGINGPEQVGGEVGGVVAQASAPPFQPPQDQPNSIPAVATGDRARWHAIARAYALGIPIPEIITETAE